MYSPHYPDPRPLADALDRVQFGVIITGDARAPSFVNCYAREVLEQGDGLKVGPLGLEAVNASDTRDLRDAISRAVRRESRAAATFVLPRLRASRPLIAFVPLPLLGPSATSETAVFVCDPERSPAVDPAALTRLFGLTRAEAKFATLLMTGTTVEDASTSLGIGINTGRAHLRRILMKTDTGRQADLLRLLIVCSGQISLS